MRATCAPILFCSSITRKREPCYRSARSARRSAGNAPFAATSAAEQSAVLHLVLHACQRLAPVRNRQIVIFDRRRRARGILDGCLQVPQQSLPGGLTERD